MVTPAPETSLAASTTAATLVSATLYLMSAYASNGCPRLAIMIRRHLDLLAVHPEIDPLLARTSSQLIERYWSTAESSARALLARQHETRSPAAGPLH